MKIKSIVSSLILGAAMLSLSACDTGGSSTEDITKSISQAAAQGMSVSINKSLEENSRELEQTMAEVEQTIKKVESISF